MRGPILAVCLASALCVSHSTQPPSADRAAVVSTSTPPLEIANAPEAVGPPAEVPKPVSRPVSDSWGSNTAPISTAPSFSYQKNHPATPLPALAFAAMAGVEPQNADEFGPTYTLPPKPIDVRAGQLPVLSRDALCSAVVAVARANDLPIPFFANLIWQESSFRLKTISHAGALGIAQFIPETAIEHGLMNPFEPVHALFASGKLLRKLNNQFGNFGLAAAAYNAGPQRVYAWMAARRTLPGETRAYVVRITGHPADRWRSKEFPRDPEATLMPARAPCAEVVEEVTAQKKIVRVAKLISELAAATAPPRPVEATPLASGAKVAPKLAAPIAASRKIADRLQPEVSSRQRTQIAARTQSKPGQQTSKVEKNPAAAANAGRKRVAAQ